jgi:hypothetical protein
MDDPDFNPSRPAAPNDALFSMRRLSNAATRIFMALVDGLAVGGARRLDNAHGSFMAVSIDYLVGFGPSHDGARHASLFAIAHRYETNGDLVPDPDVEFYVVEAPAHLDAVAVYPTAIDHGPVGYYRHVHFDSAGQPARISRRGQADLASFCNLWMRNIAIQQGLPW